MKQAVVAKTLLAMSLVRSLAAVRDVRSIPENATRRCQASQSVMSPAPLKSQSPATTPERRKMLPDSLADVLCVTRRHPLP
jgi:hypothetical protein